MKSRHLLMIAGLGLAGALAWSGSDNPSDPAEPVVHDAARPPGALPQKQTAPKRDAGRDAELPMLALLDRASAIATGQEGLQAGRLFGAHSWAPPAAPVAVASAPAAQPVAPPLPFAYIGRKTQGGQVEVFLGQGDKVHVVGVASLIENIYRVDAISPTAVSFTYLPLLTSQQLPIGASD